MAICLNILFLFGALLSFADPITDGLTCWKYFEDGEILWFVLCILFIVLPGIMYLIFWLCIMPSNESTSSGQLVTKLRCCVISMCCPFLPCCGKLYVALTTKKHEDHKLYIEVFNCLEVGVELAPQFILQFYAAMVQSRTVSTIQIVSLTITFLRIGWCYANINEDCTCQLCFGGLISVAARVFAFSLFAVALGPWVVLIIALHMALTCVIQRSHRVRAFGYVVLSWLSYTPLGKDKETEEERLTWASRTFIQPLLHVVEDIFMAVMYYVKVDSDTRSYPHRLKIMLGLIGGTLFGYFVLRLARFVKCQSEQEQDANIQDYQEDLANEEPEPEEKITIEKADKTERV